MENSNNSLERDVSSNAKKIKMSAMKLFSIYGYGSTTVRMIGQDAGLSAGQIAAHFGSKEELFKSIIHDVVMITDEEIYPIEIQRNKLIREGKLTKENSWGLIQQLVTELIDYCFVPYNRMCIMMVNVELPNSQIVENARKTFQEILLKRHEMLLAQLLQVYADRKGYLKFRVISRAVIGSIVSFAEHSEFLMEEVYSNKDSETVQAYAKGHLKNYTLNCLKNIDGMDDFTNVEKYQ